MKVLKFLLEWLIPAAALSDPFEQRRARVFGVLCVLLFVVETLAQKAFFWVGDYPLAVAHLLPSGAPPPLPSSSGVAGAAVADPRIHPAGLVDHHPGEREARGCWASLLAVYAVMPISVTFILGIRSGAVWCAVGLATVGALALLEGTGLMVFEDAFAESTLLMDTAVGVITIAASFILAFFFEDARRESRAAALQAAREQASAEETAALVRAEKMATVGLLAAGVGHEINNPLTYIQSNIEHVLDELQQLDLAGPDLVDALTDALDGTLRIAQITGDLATYARVDKPEPTSVVRLDEAARTALDLTRHQLSHRASIAADLPVVPPVLATEGKVVQVLVNLLLNAAHAIERRPGGRVVLRTGHEAQKSWVEVEDNGPGCRRRPQQDFRPVLHHQGGREGHRAGPVGQPVHHALPRR